MRIVSAHNFYRSDAPSGENLVVERERRLLTAAGHGVIAVDRHSDDLLKSRWVQLRCAAELGPRVRRRRSLHQALAPLRRDHTILHVHNLWPLFTYDLLVVAKELDFVVVQTLHNYRQIATDTHLIERAGPRKPRDSAEALHLRRMPAMHGGRLRNALYTRALGAWCRDPAWPDCVDRWLCLTEFQRRCFLAAGWPAARLSVKPNFVPDLERLPVSMDAGDYVLFVGRLKAEKGIDRLVRLWPRTGLPLRVVGDGPLRDRLPRHAAVEYLGQLPPEAVLQQMAGARFLVHLSNWYETFGLVLAEAMAMGTPCLAPAFGVMPEVVLEGRCGRLFDPEDDADLLAAVADLWERAPTMRADCRASVAERFGPEANLRQLESIYAELS